MREKILAWFGVFFLGPLAAAQAGEVQKRGVYENPCAMLPPSPSLAHDFGDLCRYEAANAMLPPATDQRVVYLGDSITESWGSGIVGLSEDVVNRGINGQTSIQMLVRFRADVLNLNPRVLHLLAGTNDLAGNTGPTSIARIQNALRSLAEQAEARGIRVVLGSILPAASYPWSPEVKPAPWIRELNRWLKEYAESRGHVYADYYSPLTDNEGGFLKRYSEDGVHPNGEGYARMREVAVEAMRKAGGK